MSTKEYEFRVNQELAIECLQETFTDFLNAQVAFYPEIPPLTLGDVERIFAKRPWTREELKLDQP